MRKNSLSLLTRPMVFLFPVIALGIAMAYAHIEISRLGEDYKGALLLADHIFDLSFAVGLTALAFCIGRKGARLLSLSFANLAEELSFSIMIGVGIVGLVTLGLGLAGFLAPVPVLISIALLLILSWREVGTLCRVLKEGVGERPQLSGRRRIGQYLCGHLVGLPKQLGP